MSRLQKNVSLKSLNTFGIDAACEYLLETKTETSVVEFLMDNTFSDVPVSVLGGGSNVLLTGNIPGVVILNRIIGRKVLREDDHYVWLQIGAGENWHETVLFCIDQGWGGIENLSLIPGCVGAAPIQNIGAYGVELKDVFDSLEAINLKTGNTRTFDLDSCAFGYRESVFKGELKGEYLITRVVLRLSKNPVLNTSYGAIGAELENVQGPVGIREVSEAVIRIRQSKLPDPAEIGNGGSFFKNPVIAENHFETLKEAYPEMPFYPAEEGFIKVPAAWLIQTCGWKGYRRGDAGVHKNQALVLVNYGEASGREIYDLSTEIKASVKEKFLIDLEREVNVLP